MHLWGRLHNLICRFSAVLHRIIYAVNRLLNGRALFWGFAVMAAALYLVLTCRGYGTAKLALQPTSQSDAAAETGDAAAVLCEVYKSPWNKSCDFTLNAVHSKTKILLYGKYLDEEIIAKLQRSEYVYINSDFEVPSENGNFHGFELQRYIKAKGVDFVTYPSNKEIKFSKQGVESEALHSVMYYSSRLRQLIENSLRTNMSEDTANISMSIMTGDTADMTQEDKSAFQRSGMSHLMAVSGAHVAFVTKPINALIQRIKFKRNGLVKRSLMLLPFIFAITFVSGFSPSMVRAALMGSYGIFAKVFKRRNDNLNALGFAGLISLLINPFYVYDTGFILSYLACLSIYLILPKFKAITHKDEAFQGTMSLKPFAESFFMGLAVNLGMFPVIINMFNGMSLAGIILNVFASPIAEFICTVGYIVTFFELAGLPSFLCEIASYPIELMSLLLKMTASGGNICDKDGGIFYGMARLLGYRNYPSIPIALIALYYCVILIVFVCNKKNVKKLTVICVAAVIPVMILSMPAKAEFVFFDVGQGVSVLVKARDGSCGLIDTGDGKTDVSSLLFKEGVGKLDFIVVSHGHNDHYGGLAAVLEEHSVDMIFVPQNTKDEWVNSFIEENPQQRIVRVGGNLKAEAGKYLELDMYCLADSEENINNASVVTFLSGDWGSVLLTGDIEKEAEYDLAELISSDEKQLNDNIDLLCVAHHGSNTSSSEVFLETVTPKYAIISVGKGNLYGHPSSDAVARLEKHTASGGVFSTDKCGAVRYCFNMPSDKLLCKISDFDGDDRIVWRQKRRRASA